MCVSILMCPFQSVILLLSKNAICVITMRKKSSQLIIDYLIFFCLFLEMLLENKKVRYRINFVKFCLNQPLFEEAFVYHLRHVCMSHSWTAILLKAIIKLTLSFGRTGILVWPLDSMLEGSSEQLLQHEILSVMQMKES